MIYKLVYLNLLLDMLSDVTDGEAEGRTAGESFITNIKTGPPFTLYFSILLFFRRLFFCIF